jgi:SAM-dependent methyltransferase
VRVRQSREQRPLTIPEVAACYRGAGRVYAGYIAAKLRIDPIHRAAPALLPLQGQIVDLGCGAGQLTLLCAGTAPGRAVLGIDRDWGRIARARTAASAAPQAQLRYLIADVRVAPIPRCRGILLVDLLHSLLPAEQDALLRRAARALEPGGVLLVREVDRGAVRWRFALVALEEWLTTSLGWAPGGGLWFRPAQELVDVLASEGLVTEVMPMWGRTPFANVLLVGRRAR